LRTLGDLVKDSADVLIQRDLNELLFLHPLVEKNHFKLWLASMAVLQRIVQSGIWARSEALLEDINSRVQLYVQNPSYGRAAEILTRDTVVVICGAPGVGKSLLAEMLLLTYWHEGWQVVQVGSDIEEAWASWRSGERQVFFMMTSWEKSGGAGARLIANWVVTL
jgi:conflict system STAND superfamily ATPase